MLVLLLFCHGAFQFLVGLFKFVDFNGQLRIATSSSSRSLRSTRCSSWFCPLEVLLRGPIGIILPSVRSFMGGVYAPMFLTERTVFLHPVFLGLVGVA